MANKYLVVHPKLSMADSKGKLIAVAKGEEISLNEANAKKLIASGKVSLVVAKKK